jgi:arabinogalactan oligomer/maltooligosaccharide transport system substrate-binding protein
MPFDGLIDTSTFIPNTLAAVTADGHLWGVPISNGNQLMLYWNKSIAGDTVPANSDALAAAAKKYTDAAAGKYGLVFNQTESFWLVPFLGGYNGSVFAADGVTPTLNTDAMKSALTLLHNWKFTDQITPPEADYNGADGLFKAGKAAFIINGDWAMADYVKAFPGKLGVAPIPTLTGGSQPKPYTAGAFFMMSKKAAADSAKSAVLLDFIKFATAKDEQVKLVNVLQRLPANAAALADPVVTGNALLAGAAQAVQLGVPQPTNLQMRCVFDSMTTGVRDLFSKSASDPATIAAAMQKSADAGVAPGGECAS